MMRLCERFHISPQELADTDFSLIRDWLTIMQYETELK